MRLQREESEERKRRERNAQVLKRGFCRKYLGGDQMIVYTSEKERCCSTNKDIARERERHGDAQTRLHLHRLAPTVESEIPIAAIAVTNIPRVGGTKVFVACVQLYTRVQAIHVPIYQVSKRLKAMGMIQKLENWVPHELRERDGICSQYIPSRCRFEAIHSLPDPTRQIRSWKAYASSATRDKPVSSSTMTTKERKLAKENDRGKARRNHEISFDRADV
ncbi:hypothetical protein ALC62_10352 [Cyphomyrmex costatus]|uniref:Uncharacterized protein n=1 Tax=Cyphomyrmex costatus TaxID=456900 RepID=A0A151IE24_9HYME|nr:hypothetical protein ALC62_10352 [Cyphomyrmex costatus]